MEQGECPVMVTPEMCATTYVEHPTLITGLAAALTHRTVSR